MNPLSGKTEKETKKLISGLRKKIKFHQGLDSCTFIMVRRDPERLVFNIKAKNNCGYKSVDIDDDIEVDLIEAERLLRLRGP
jgi:hypothetical protein